MTNSENTVATRNDKDASKPVILSNIWQSAAPSHIPAARKGAELPNKRLSLKSALLGPVHTNPDISENGDFFLRFQKNTRPHVAFSNRIRPSTRIR